jgi:hypothetical protein
MEVIYYFGYGIYCCDIQGETIPENQELIFLGTHIEGKTNEDVTSINFKNCVIKKVPQGLTKIFPNLRTLKIFGCGLSEICKADLAEYKKLIEIRMRGNKLQYLPGDLFEGFENLKAISFGRNELKVVEPNLLDGLLKLEAIDFMENPNCIITSLCVCRPDDPDFKEEFNKYKHIVHYYAAGSDEARAIQLIKVGNSLIKNFFVSRANVVKFITKFPDPMEVLDKYYSYADPETKIWITKFKSERLFNEKIIKNAEVIQNINQNTLADDLKKRTQNHDFKDFLITIGDQQFKVHKFLLTARSPTLAELLKNNPEVENLNLVDISVEIFEIILKFLYTDELPDDDGTNFLHLFAAAGKLKIKKLLNFAASKICNQITLENAFEILTLSNKFEHEQLRKNAFAGVKRKYPDIGFKDDCAAKPEKVAKLIEGYDATQALIRDAKRKFESLMDED